MAGTLDIDDILLNKETAFDKGSALESEDGESKLVVGESGIKLYYKNTVISLSDSDVSLSGDTLNINVPLGNIMFNGTHQLNPQLILGFPSTIVTPIPTLIPKPGAQAKMFFEKFKEIGSLFNG